MSKELEQIQESLKKASSACRVLQAVFTAMIVCLSVGGIALIVLIIADFAGIVIPQFTEPLNIQSALLLAISLCIWTLLFIIARSIVRDVASNKNPFTIDHARQIRMLGVFFAADVCINLVIPPAFAAIGHVGLLNVGYVSSAIASYPVIPLDVRGLLGMVICFALSQVWRYGALLQNEADELF